MGRGQHAIETDRRPGRGRALRRQGFTGCESRPLVVASRELGDDGPRHDRGPDRERGNTVPCAAGPGEQPLVRREDLVVIGRRDDPEAPWYGQDVLRAGPMLDLTHATIRDRGIGDVVALALERVTRPGVYGFWIHVDADVVDPSEIPAVDSPEPGGLLLGELSELLTPLIHHPDAIGLELTIYDPQLDPDRASAARLASLLERAIGRIGGDPT